MLTSGEHFFFIGIGGAGMAPLALYLKQMGVAAAVSGMDDAPRFPAQTLLENSGIQISPTAIERASVCVYSSAIPSHHPMRQKAQALRLPLISRGALLAQCAREKQLMAIVGSHGKTTTCGWLIHLIKKLKLKAGYILGGLFQNNTYLPAAYDPSDWLVAEIDESDGTIQNFTPEITLAVNFDWDHADYYPTEQHLKKAFLALFERTRRLVIIPDDCPVLKALAQASGTPTDCFGLSALKQLERSEIVTTKKASYTDLSELTLQAPFNQRNVAAAATALSKLTPTTESESFKGFPGIWRRQEILFCNKHQVVLADYAHHPTEIAALLNYVVSAESFPKPLTVVFQPHRYTRTQQFSEAFACVLSVADVLHLLPVYSAGECLNANGTTACIQKFLTLYNAHYHSWDSWDALKVHLLQQHSSGGSLLFIGAGDVYIKAKTYIEALPTASTGKPETSLESEQLTKGLSSATPLLIDEPLRNKTTFQLEGKAQFFAEPWDMQDLLTLVQNARQAGIPYFVLGKGSNVLVPSVPFGGLIIRLNKPHWKAIEQLEEGRLKIGAGCRLQQICAYACNNGLAGLEFLEGIPGSLGGALRMNAGAMGSWMFDFVEAVVYLDCAGALQRATHADFTPTYRECPELKGTIILNATLKASGRDSPAAIKNRIASFTSKRRSTQPREASAGSVFKNPDGMHAAKLIEDLNLKGFSVGQAQISPLHANFIVNKGNARASDVLELIQEVHRRVYQKAGVLLEPEVVLIGTDWKDILNM